MQSARRKYASARQLQRRSEILASARAMLNDAGYAGMTMRGLAERAGVAPATLYNLYGSKDGLILAAVDDLLTELATRAADSAPRGGIDAILVLTEVLSEQIQATPSYAEAMARALFKVEADDPLVEVLFARSFPFLAAELATAQRNGDLSPEADPDRIARHLTGQFWGVVLLWMMGMLPLVEIVHETVRSHMMTLVSVTRGAARRRLEDALRELDRRSRSRGRGRGARRRRAGSASRRSR